MKNTIKFLAVALCMFVAVGVNAQEKKGDKDFKKMRMERLSENLSLTAEQQQKVEALLEKQDIAREKTREARQEKMKTEKDAFKNDMKQILTDEQFTKFEEMHAKKGKDGKMRGKMGKGKSCDKDGKKACCASKKDDKEA